MCADCGDVVSIHNAEGKWCGDCFDLGLKRDMHDFSIQNIKSEMEGEHEKESEPGKSPGTLQQRQD